MCLDGKTEPVEIKKKIGYAFAERNKKTGEYVPYYIADGKNYKQGVKYRATFFGDDVDKSFEEGGFYFFGNKQEAAKAMRDVCAQGTDWYDVVLLKCEFRGVFEKGRWGAFTAYRATYRTILEEIGVKW